MEILYNPERQKYTQSSRKKSSKALNECPFCTQPAAHNDEKYLIIKRYKHVFICMNRYPYNAGHLLVIPFKHEKNIAKLSTNAAHEMITATQIAVKVLEKALKPNAFNIGINMGSVAGGSIPDHLHTHILPRFEGDANFLTLLNNTKPIFCDIPALYQKLKKEFSKK